STFSTKTLAQQAGASSCQARMTLAYEKTESLTGFEKLMARSGAVSLDKNKSENLVLTLANHGKTEKFEVVIEPLGGVQVTAGGSVRKIAVKSRESGKLALTVKGLDVGESCNWRSRGLRVTARPEDVSTEKVCAVLEARFLCPQNNKAPRM